MYMTVLHQQADGTVSMACINLNDVDYIEVEGRKIIYHIKDEVYRHITTLSELEDQLYSEGFDLLDKTNLVNLSKVKSFDDKHGKVYFAEDPSADSKYATVALIKQNLIKKEFHRAEQEEGKPSLEYVLRAAIADDRRRRKGIRTNAKFIQR